MAETKKTCKDCDFFYQGAFETFCMKTRIPDIEEDAPICSKFRQIEAAVALRAKRR